MEFTISVLCLSELTMAQTTRMAFGSLCDLNSNTLRCKDALFAMVFACIWLWECSSVVVVVVSAHLHNGNGTKNFGKGFRTIHP